MANYMDQVYAAADGVLLSYAGQDVSLKITTKLGYMPIHTIGKGALMDSDKLQQVIVPVGVRRIGEKAFYGCKNLKKVYLPGSVVEVSSCAFCDCHTLRELILYDMKLTGQQYQSLVSSGLRVNGSTLLLSDFPDNKFLKDLVASTGTSPANPLPLGLKQLLTSYSLEDEKGSGSIDRNLQVYTVGGAEQKTMTEREAFRSSMSGGFAQTDAKTEEGNDAFEKKDIFPIIVRTALFTIDDSRTIHRDGAVIVTAVIHFGYHFWQSQVPIVCNGNQYSIYRRHYLTAEQNLCYIRRDVAVFSGDGTVSNQEEAREVYARYKLLSIL